MGWGAVAAAAVSAVSASRANNARSSAASATNTFNAQEARKNREFQARMSNTAHFRQVRDLKRAGLNPILSAKYGGATTPTGSAATGVMPQINDEWTPAINTGMQAYLAEANVQKTNAETENIQMTTQKVEQEISNLQVSERLTEEQIKAIAPAIQKALSETDLNYAKSYGQDLSNLQEAIIAKFYDDNEAARIMKEFNIDASVIPKIFQGLLKKGFKK